MKKRKNAACKTTDEIAAIRCAAGDGMIREEVWKDEEGTVTRYNLTFINHSLFPGDNGRVLGYDTAHEQAHRHYAGTVEATEPAPYEKILERFLTEVAELRMRKTL